MPSSWKQELKEALRTAEDLVQEGWIDSDRLPQYKSLLAKYPLVLPRYYAGLIDRNNPTCPIRLQAIPQLQENAPAPEGKADPLEDLVHAPAPRITHRYTHRALLHLTPNCSMVCRYCFRKTLLGEDRSEFFKGELEQGLEYLCSHPLIEEVIFSGGDPFLANEATLEQCLLRLAAAPRIRRVRFHTRVPVTLPSRVEPAFCQKLLISGKPTVVVTHFNHPREITTLARDALHHMKRAGITLLNQSVLLEGVNARAETLAELSASLFDAGVLPYYLHHPDRAAGTLHFDLPAAKGIRLWTQLRERLPGYLVPKYVVDDPAHPFKRDVLSLPHSTLP